MLRTRVAGLGLLAGLLVLLAGCGGSNSISGEVAYEGQPVEDGAITFLPADGKGPVVGAPIRQGRYAVSDILPGKKLVKIEGFKAVPFARSSEEMAKMAAEARKQGDPSGIIDRADVIPENAVGNNAELEIQPGQKTHDFRLQKPEAKKR